MGYNRSGKRRKERLKRHKKLVKRLLGKEEKLASEAKPAEAK